VIPRSWDIEKSAKQPIPAMLSGKNKKGEGFVFSHLSTYSWTPLTVVLGIPSDAPKNGASEVGPIDHMHFELLEAVLCL
jgi:hypothetical protein